MPWVDQDQQRAELMAAQKEYALEIDRWLRREFPSLCDDEWGPHPAAFTAVIRLHYRDGKGRLTRARHGHEICAAVERWELEWGGDEQPKPPDLLARLHPNADSPSDLPSPKRPGPRPLPRPPAGPDNPTPTSTSLRGVSRP
jgi:hypothetical protein